MIIIGCDYQPGFQQIASVNSETGELSEARLGHKEQAEQVLPRPQQGRRARARGYENPFAGTVNECNRNVYANNGFGSLFAHIYPYHF